MPIEEGKNKTKKPTDKTDAPAETKDAKTEGEAK